VIEIKLNKEIVEQIQCQLEKVNSGIYFLCIGGSDAYGFSSENNSDVDIRGAYYYTNSLDMFNLPIERKLTKRGEYDINGVKYDWEMHEISKFFRLLGKSNMNVLDWVFSDWIDGISKKIEIIKNAYKCIDRGLLHHALGWSKSMYKMDWNDPKKILHCIRPLMTVVNYIDFEVYDVNIMTMLLRGNFLEEYRQLVHQLIDFKKNGKKVNDITHKKSLEMYDVLIQYIKENENKVPERNEVDIRKVITEIRLNTMRVIENGKIDRNRESR